MEQLKAFPLYILCRYNPKAITDEIMKFNLPNENKQIPLYPSEENDVDFNMEDYFILDINNPRYREDDGDPCGPYYYECGMGSDDFSKIIARKVLNWSSITKEFILNHVRDMGIFTIVLYYDGLTKEEKKKLLFDNLDKAFYHNWDYDYNYNRNSQDIVRFIIGSNRKEKEPLSATDKVFEYLELNSEEIELVLKHKP